MVMMVNFVLCISPPKKSTKTKNQNLAPLLPQERDDRIQFPLRTFVANLGAVVASVSNSISCLCPEFVVW